MEGEDYTTENSTDIDVEMHVHEQYEHTTQKENKMKNLTNDSNGNNRWVSNLHRN